MANDTIKHIEVIPQRHREIFCNKTQGCRRYTTDWIYGWPTQIDRSIFIKTDAEKLAIKRMR